MSQALELLEQISGTMVLSKRGKILLRNVTQFQASTPFLFQGIAKATPL